MVKATAKDSTAAATNHTDSVEWVPMIVGSSLWTVDRERRAYNARTNAPPRACCVPRHGAGDIGVQIRHPPN